MLNGRSSVRGQLKSSVATLAHRWNCSISLCPSMTSTYHFLHVLVCAVCAREFSFVNATSPASSPAAHKGTAAGHAAGHATGHHHHQGWSLSSSFGFNKIGIGKDGRSPARSASARSASPGMVAVQQDRHRHQQDRHRHGHHHCSTLPQQVDPKRN